MLKKLPLAILAASTVGATFAADNFVLDNAVDTVVIQDNVWGNPAALLNTSNQVAVTDNGNAGVVFEAAGQKLGVHVGRDAEHDFIAAGAGGNVAPSATDTSLDLFWGADLGAKTGLRFGYTVDSDKTLALTTFNAPSFGDDIFPTEGNTTFEDADGNKATLNITGNELVTSLTTYELSFGQILARGGYSVNFSLPTFNNQSLVSYTASTDQAADGAPDLSLKSTANRQASSDFSFEVSGGFKQFFSRSFYVTGGGAYNSYNTSLIIENENISTVGTTETKTASQSTSSFGLNVIAASVGAGLVQRNAATTVRVEGGIDYSRSVSTSSGNATVVEGVEAPKGTNSGSKGTENNITVPFAVSVEASKPGSSFTWRAGASADLLELMTDKDTTNSYSANSDATGFDLDYAKIDGQSSELNSNASQMFLGMGWAPVENLEFNAVINQAFVKSSFVNNGFASKLSASYSF